MQKTKWYDSTKRWVWRLGWRFCQANCVSKCPKNVRTVLKDIDIVGVGGVAHGTDAFELILCSKGRPSWDKALDRRASCFERIGNELKTMTSKKDIVPSKIFVEIKTLSEGKKTEKSVSKWKFW